MLLLLLLLSFLNVTFCPSSVEMEETSEAESRCAASGPSSPLILDELKAAKAAEFSLAELQTQPKCEVYPDLHKIIQVEYKDIAFLTPA